MKDSTLANDIQADTKSAAIDSSAARDENDSTQPTRSAQLRRCVRCRDFKIPANREDEFSADAKRQNAAINRRGKS